MKHDLTGVRRGLLLLAMLLACLWNPVAALGAMFGDVMVDEMAIPRPIRFKHGSVEYRFRVSNTSPDKTHHITLELPGDKAGGSGTLRRSVTLAPQTQAHLSLWQPEMSLAGSNLLVRVDGAAYVDDKLPVQVAHYDAYHVYRSSSSQSRQVLLSPSVGGAVRDALEKRVGEWVDSSSTSSWSRNEFELERAASPVAQWSDAWQAYTSYDGLIVTAADMHALPGPVHDAILAYVELGGTLLVIGEWNPPAPWLGIAGSPGTTLGGGLSIGPVGLGTLGRLPVGVAEDLTAEQFKQADEHLWARTARSEQEKRSVTASNESFPVITSARIPVRAMLALMVLFTILIGPVNMIVFARLNKRLWTLVTIPAFAILFSVTALLFALLAEGISPVGRTSTLTLLDQTTGKATTVGWIGLYAPLQPGDGLKFAHESQVLLQNQADSWQPQDAADRSIDWTQGQHLTRGWISARVPTYFTYKNSQTRREQLQVTQDDQGNITIVNGLGADIEQLWLADEQGITHTTDQPVKAGQRVELMRHPDSNPNSHHQTFENLPQLSWRASPGVLQEASMSGSVMALPRGTYRAVLTEPVFAEKGLPKLKRHESQTTVYGRYAVGSAGRRQAHAD